MTTLFCFFALLSSLDARTVTFSATTLVMHTGDSTLPPLMYSVSGGTYGTNYTGAPSLSTTATFASAPGTYPITIAQGSLSAVGGASFSFTAGTLTVLPVTVGAGAKLSPSVAHPSGFMLDVTTQGVDSTGATDASAAINRLLQANRTEPTEYYANPHLLYFPAGTYLICSQPLIQYGDTTTIEGSGVGQTIFKIPANCPAFNAGSNTAVYYVPSISVNENFRNYINNVTIDIGPGNYDAIGLDYVGNNSAGIENVQILSEDGSAPICLKTDRGYDGPSLKKNVALYGCQTAWKRGSEAYSSADENITMQGFLTVGITDVNFPFAMRHLLSCGSPTALSNSGSNINLLDSELLCGASGSTAIANTGGAGSIFARNVKVGGYGTSINDQGVTSTGNVVQHWTGAARTLFSSSVTPSSLYLPESETPVATDPDPSSWLALSANAASWSAQLADSTSSTAYVPVATNSGVLLYPSSSAFYIPVVVPDTINHLTCYDAMMTSSQYGETTYVNFIVNGSSATPLVIERCAVQFLVTHNGTRTVVMRHMLSQGYVPHFGAGNAYFEDVQVQNSTVTFQPGQHIWARQFDQEQAAPKITCNTCTLWILGLKTETSYPSLVLNNNAQAEIFGSLLYPIYSQPSTSTLVQINNSSVFINFEELVYNAGDGMAYAVTETRGSSTRQLATNGQSAGFNLGMYYSVPTPSIGSTHVVTGKQGKTGHSIYN